MFLVANIGNLISANNLKSLAGVKSTNTILGYLNFLEASYLIQLMHALVIPIAYSKSIPAKFISLIMAYRLPSLLLLLPTGDEDWKTWFSGNCDVLTLSFTTTKTTLSAILWLCTRGSAYPYTGML